MAVREFGMPNTGYTSGESKSVMEKGRFTKSTDPHVGMDIDAEPPVGIDTEKGRSGVLALRNAVHFTVTLHPRESPCFSMITAGKKRSRKRLHWAV